MKVKAFWISTLFLLLGALSLTQARRPLLQRNARNGEPSRHTQSHSSEPATQQIVEAYGKLPLTFEANQGQSDPRVKFLSRGSGYALFLTSGEAVLSLRKPQETPSTPSTPIGMAVGQRTAARFRNTGKTSETVVRMRLVGANPAPRITGLEQLPGKVNYFVGNDPARWRNNVPTYGKVRYEGVYPGVDLVYYGNQRQLEYDFVVAPGVDPGRMRLAIAGAEKLGVGTNGDLVLRITGGEVRLHKPIVYQQAGDVRKEIAGRYVLRGKRQIGFELAAYDATMPLIIDPVMSYSTYLGGSAPDFGNAIAADSSGNAYVTGNTASLNFPTKNPMQASLAGGSDVFVTKLDPTGSTLIYSTYLGGSANDSGSGIAVDGSGNAYVTGQTSSTNFPTKNPFQAALGTTSGNAFVAKLDPAGSTLVYSTYLGGSGGGDAGNGIAVDASGNAYVTGSTASANFPTKNPFQAALGSNNGNAFVAKLDPAGSALVYSTYLGGSGGGDSGKGIAVDASGNAYVTGGTGSTNFPTKNPFQAALGSNNGNAFVAKLDPTGSALVYSTYLGGSGGGDSGKGIAVDASGNAYVTGGTGSTNFPTKNPFQAALGSISGNAFVAKLNAAGSALVFSTYLGGSGNGTDGDFGNGIAVDASNNTYVTGFTSSPNFPLASPIQASFVSQTCFFSIGGYGPYTEPCGNTAFVTKLNPAGSTLAYSTYVGASGGGFEEGRGIAVDTAGNAYVTGSATSSFPFPPSFPVTPGAFQLVPGGGGDAFVAKISPNDAAGFSLTSFSLAFPDEGIGGTTAAQTVTLANSGSATLSITSIVPSGDFAETNTCGSSLAGGTSCTINVTFTPTAAGARTGTITITDSVASSPQKITLTGNGLAGVSATLSSTSLSFGNQTVAGPPSAAQSVTLTNTGSATLTINGFSLAGTNPSDFNLLANCNQGQSLAVGASCTFSIGFVPQAVGNRSATLQILDNSAQSPRTVALTGVGLAPPTVALSPTSLTFAAQIVGSTSPGQTITLTTSGSGTLAISSIGTSVGDFGQSNNCGTTLPGGGSCTITVTFTPTVPGNRTGMLVIVSNAANGMNGALTVSLTGMGLAPPTVALSPTSLSFGAQVVGTTSQPQTVTLTTSGSGTLAISSITTSVGDFAASNNCGASVAGGASCTITVTFTPTVPGNRTGMLVIASNAANGTNGALMVSLSGFGTSGTDFSISPAAGSSSSATVTAGQPATYTVSVAGTSGFSGTVSLSCSDPAPQSTCGVSPNSLMVNGTTPVNATVTVTTMARSALPPSLRLPTLSPGLRVVLPWLLLFLSLVMLVTALRRRSRERRRAWVGLATMLMAAALFFGCGGGGSNAPPPPPQGTPAGTYPITVTATSPGVAHTATLSLTVN